jgi:hypothetical protein
MWPFKKSDYKQGLADGRIGLKCIQKYEESAEYKRGHDEGWQTFAATLRNHGEPPGPGGQAPTDDTVETLIAMELTGGPNVANLTGQDKDGGH